MADAFILGAGFSKAIAATMPLTFELGTRSVDQLKSVHAARISPGEHSTKCDGLSCDGNSPIGVFYSGTLDFEEWLTTLAEPQPYLLMPENARREALFSELTGSIAWVIEQSQARTVEGKDPPPWLARLVTEWHRRRSFVVTFNYDTLIEATVDCLQIAITGDPHPMTHKTLGPSVIQNWTPMWDGVRLHAAESFRYSKLHGSTHWCWDSMTKAADSIVQIGLRHEWKQRSQSFDDAEQEHRAPGKVPMIVPPTTGKSTYFNNPVIRYLWHDAFSGLAKARRIFVFGYSLPPGDTLVRSMLAELLPGKELWVINPNSDVRDRFATLKPAALVERFVANDMAPDDFVEAYSGLDQ